MDSLFSKFNFQTTDKVTGFEELRLPFPKPLIPACAHHFAYHSFLLLHIERDWALCIEKVPTGLEVMAGSLETLAGHVEKWGIFSQKRTQYPDWRPVEKGEYEASPQGVSLKDLTEWLEREAQQPYCLVKANCQHFIQHFYHRFRQKLLAPQRPPQGLPHGPSRAH
jgi:hypothetical protein